MKTGEKMKAKLGEENIDQRQNEDKYAGLTKPADRGEGK